MKNFKWYLCLLVIAQNHSSYVFSMEPQQVIAVGVDVGGTNTDAVLVSGNRLISKHKTATTPDITTGVVKAITALFEEHKNLKAEVKSINIGTTHLLNALLERKGLTRPLVIRLGAPATTAVPPALDWPQDLKEQLLGNEAYIERGGLEFNGVEIAPLDTEALIKLAYRTLDASIKSVAITGVFANVDASQEEAAKALFKRINPNVEVSLSHTMGNLGILARENATILNACLTEHYVKVSRAFKEAVNHLGIKTNVFLTYGDGTKTNLNDLSSTPLRTLNSGPINSIKGAALLAHIKDGVTVDIGGTSSDVGLIKDGQPVNESSHFSIAGIQCNFSSARFNSFALGGGTIIKPSGMGTGTIGPESVAKDLCIKALVYGGDTLTVTDIACALGRLHLGVLDQNALKHKISSLVPGQDVNSFIKSIDELIHEKLAHGILQVIGSMESVPAALVLVGGGASLFDLNNLQKLLASYFTSILIPQSADVANALGAAHSLIGGKYVQVYNYAHLPRHEALAQATHEAKKNAIAKGADPKTLTIASIHEIPLNYLVGDPNQLTVSVVGNDRGDYTASLDTPVIAIVESTIQNRPQVTSEHVRIEKVESLIENQNTLKLENVEYLTKNAIDDLALGAGILGSGGGGSPWLGHQMALYALSQHAKIKRIALKDLPDDAFVVVFGGMGSPTVAAERLLSVSESIRAIRQIEKSIGKRVDALVTMEAGGMNALYPLFACAMLDIPVVDCDCMGRAFPGINMVTPTIYGTFDEHYAALSNGRKDVFVRADQKNFTSLENDARAVTLDMGGIASIAYLPMTGAQAKQWTIPHSLSIAQALGKALRESQNLSFNQRLAALNTALALTDYKQARKVCEGKIIAVRRKESKGFSIGGFVVENSQTKEKVEVGFQNENLVARRQGTHEILAQVPDLITVVDKNNFQPISCEDLAYGQEVVVLTLTAPKMMATEKALAVVGPQVYPMDLLFDLLSSHLEKTK